MQLITSRQAWHDCLYTPANSALQSTVEQAVLGILTRPSGGMSGDWKKTKVGAGADFGGHKDDSGILRHRATAGLIQSAIATLPKKLQQFGCVMYAPITFVSAADVEDVIDLIVSRVINRISVVPHSKIEVIEALSLAQVLRHRALVVYQPDPFKSVKELRDFCWDEKGIKIPAQDFTRNWGGVISSIRAVIDDLDVLALWPVSDVIKLHNDLDKNDTQVDAEILWKNLFRKARNRFSANFV